MRCRSHENVSGADKRQMSEKNTLEYFEKKYHAKPDIAYHYTSLEAFMSIVQSKTFRLTSLSMSNDKSELSYSPDQFRSDFNKATKGHACHARFASNSDKAFNEICVKGKTEKVFSLSLTSAKDNLMHWRAYGDQGKGVCICFNCGALYSMYAKLNCADIVNNLCWKAYALYDEASRIDFIKKKMDLLCEVLSDKVVSVFSEVLTAEILNSLYSLLQICTKQACFADEKEARCVFQQANVPMCKGLVEIVKNQLQAQNDKAYEQLKRNVNNAIKKIGIENEGYYLSQYGIKSYRNLCFNEVWGSGVIPEVILGPLCRQNKDELKSFLESNGLYGVEISDSQVPLR